jgi:hypothetical protein
MYDTGKYRNYSFYANWTYFDFRHQNLHDVNLLCVGGNIRKVTIDEALGWGSGMPEWGYWTGYNY